jgi:hypothetical protein
MKLSEITESDLWNLMLDYYPNFYTGEEGGDEDGNEQELDDSDVS